MVKGSFSKKLEETLIPIGNKISSQKHLKAIRDAMIAITPLALLGGMVLIVTSPPVNTNIIKPTNFFFKFLIAWKSWAVEYGMQVELLQRTTMGLMALFICIVVAYSLSRSYKIDPIGSMIIAAVCFLISSAPSNLGVMSKFININLQASKILEKQSMLMSVRFLGAEGIFTAIVIALITTEITRLLKKNNIMIKMPESVPAPVKASFSAIIPMFVNAIGIFLVSIFIGKISNGLMIPEIISSLFKPLIYVVDSPLGIIIISIITQLLWLVGLHGSSIVSGIIGAFEIGNLTINADLVTKGASPEFIYTEPFRAFFMILGGAGATIALNIILIKSKSKQLKTLGKLSIVPSIFNINEPIIFGVPLVFNAILAIPFILVQTVNGILTYILMYTDIIKKTFTLVPWTLPAPLGASLSTMDIKAGIWIILLIIIDILIWLPFFKVYEKQVLENTNIERSEK